MKTIKMTDLTHEQIAKIISATNHVFDSLDDGTPTPPETWWDIAKDEAMLIGVPFDDFDKEVLESFQEVINQAEYDSLEAFEERQLIVTDGDWAGSR